MAKTGFKSVDEYIASRPEAVKAALERVRGAIRKAIPGAEEGISYQMPAYKLAGRPVLYFAGWSKHYSLYPAGADISAAFKDELARYEVSKGAVRFPLYEPVPVRLIARIAKFRANAVALEVKARSLRGPAGRRARPAGGSGADPRERPFG